MIRLQVFAEFDLITKNEQVIMKVCSSLSLSIENREDLKKVLDGFCEEMLKKSQKNCPQIESVKVSSFSSVEYNPRRHRKSDWAY